MYTFQDKSGRNPHSNRAPKPFESKRWDHGGYDQLQSEHDSRLKDNVSNDKFKKHRKHPNDTTMASDVLDNASKDSHPCVTSSKWTHDKYAEVSNPQQTSQNGYNEKEKSQKPARRERKPDKPLYSVRSKISNPEEPKPRNSANKGVEITEAQERGKSTLLSDEVMRGPRGSEKEIHVIEDDTKSSTSNVSTAISDPFKGYEEEGSMIKDSKEAKKEPGLLFELVLDAEKQDIVKIYENEGDYEGFLDSLCGRYGIGKRMSLYFKINMMEAIMDVHPDPSKVEPVLDKLLEMNYKLMMADQEPGDIDQEILPYLNDEDQILYELDDWNHEEESSL